MTQTRRRRPAFEALEPRILYSADLNPIAAGLSAPMSLAAPMAVSAPAVEENALAGTPAGVIVAVDADDSGGFAYSLIDNAGHFTIDPSSGALTVLSTKLPDFDVSASYLLIIRATDQQGAAIDRAFT